LLTHAFSKHKPNPRAHDCRRTALLSAALLALMPGFYLFAPLATEYGSECVSGSAALWLAASERPRLRWLAAPLAGWTALTCSVRASDRVASDRERKRTHAERIASAALARGLRRALDVAVSEAAAATRRFSNDAIARRLHR
jgi:hypothetical protein